MFFFFFALYSGILAKKLYFLLIPLVCRSLLRSYGDQIGIDSERVPRNTSTIQFADAIAKAWLEYNNPRLALNKNCALKCGKNTRIKNPIC